MHYPTLRLLAAVLGVGLVAGLPGCGLVNSDVTNFDLTLPDKKFTIDANGWQVNTASASNLFDANGALRSVSCSSDPSICNTAVQQACSKGCSGTCNASSTCELSLDVSLSQSVDLVMERPELKSINDEPVIKVTIDSVTYDVATNSLNVDTPTINVYVAPTSVLSPSDPQATLIGTLAPIPAGWTTETSQNLQFTPTGKAELVKIMSSFKIPFKVLVGSSLHVTAGQALPTGKLEAVVHIKGHAGL